MPTDRPSADCVVCGQPIPYVHTLRAERVTCGAPECQRARKNRLCREYAQARFRSQYERRKRDGICTRCGRQPADGEFLRCADCRAYGIANMAKYYRRDRAKGLCGKCHRVLSRDGGAKAQCEECVRRHQIWKRGRMAQIQADPDKLQAYVEQRREGRAEAKRRLRQAGRCVDCGAEADGSRRCRDCKRAARQTWKRNRQARAAESARDG